MSVHEAVMLKLLRYAGWAGNHQASAINKSRVNTSKTVHSIISEHGRNHPAQETGGEPLIAHREVYLEGYDSHEEVVRAYLEFTDIDPDSKEGRFYFGL